MGNFGASTTGHRPRGLAALRGPSCAATALLVALTLSPALPTPAHAALPDHTEFETLLDQARPGAAQQGLALRSDGLWLALLRARTPLMAGRQGQRCHVGYSAYTPGVDHRWLFPDLPADQGRVWLAGLVRHEIAHCLLHGQGQAVAAAGTSGTAGANLHAASAQHGEALADLAFALHVDTHPAGTALIERLASLREQRRDSDPVHATAAVLRCYLRHPQRQAQAEPDAASLQAWQTRCVQP